MLWSLWAAAMIASARLAQSVHVLPPEYGSGYEMKRTPPASNQLQSSSQQPGPGEPGDPWEFGSAKRPL
jgi:hypothetical protein